jgi:hypothetical protein
VDDSDAIESKYYQPNFLGASKQLQKAVDTWEGGLKATCGAIVPEKTFWYLIDFKWSSGSWFYKTIEDSPSSIYINDISGQRKELRCYQPFDAQETLGIYLAPDGNHKQQVKKMLQISNTWADSMRTDRITKDDAWLAFNSTIWKSLLYPLPALSLSPTDCNSIMRPLLQYLLPAIGVCRNYPRSLVYSTEKYMGLGIKHLHTTQEILRLKDLLSHTDRNTTMGNLYRTSLEILIIELGMGTDLSSIPPQTMASIATNSLIKSSILFLLKQNIDLIHDISLLPLRQGDKILMSCFAQMSPSLDELWSLNNCRLYLQVYFLSEISTGDGLKITYDAWRGTRFDVPAKLASWPRQQRPSPREWLLWQLFLKKVFLLRGLKLRFPLGPWTREDNQWEWYFSPSNDQLYQCSQGIWYSFPNIIRRTKNPTFLASGKQQQPPHDLERATIFYKGQRLICTGSAPTQLVAPDIALSFMDFLAQSKEGEQWVFDHLDLLDDGL